ncbi:MAG: hypothetical protein LBV80_06270, partial [Deltaproteobacteria bacterium]|nr:hypothetical protein [Deltaproteobacteria bacterium]
NDAGITPLGRTRLNELAAQVGADVPFFLLNQPAWAEGIGEKLAPARFSFAAERLLLVCPEISVSTPWAYTAWDDLQKQNDARPTTGPAKDNENAPIRFLTSREAQDISTSSAENVTDQEFGDGFFNSFEEVVFARYPELAGIKQQLLDLGADAALMSGSGSSLFGLFKRTAQADRASEILRESGLMVYNRAIHAGASPSR